MIVREEDGTLIIRDRPAPYWLLGGFLLTGGILTIGMSLPFGAIGPGARAVMLPGGIGVVAGAVWWLRRTPGTQIEIDSKRQRLRLVRTGLGGRKVRDLALSELAATDVERGEDSDGGLVVRPMLHLRSGERLPMSLLWIHDTAGVAQAIAAVTRACRLAK